jgi:hypothetical protein
MRSLIGSAIALYADMRFVLFESRKTRPAHNSSGDRRCHRAATSQPMRQERTRKCRRS